MLLTRSPRDLVEPPPFLPGSTTEFCGRGRKSETADWPNSTRPGPSGPDLGQLCNDRGRLRAAIDARAGRRSHSRPQLSAARPSDLRPTRWIGWTLDSPLDNRRQRVDNWTRLMCQPDRDGERQASSGCYCNRVATSKPDGT